MTISMVFPSSPIKIWGKSVKGIQSYDRTYRLTEITAVYEYRWKPQAFFSWFQVDGPADSSDDDEKDEEDNDEDEDDDDDDDDDDLDPDGEDDDEGAEEEPLGSEDDISDEDATEIFETDNVVVCQYDKISRTR